MINFKKNPNNFKIWEWILVIGQDQKQYVFKINLWEFNNLMI